MCEFFKRQIYVFIIFCKIEIASKFFRSLCIEYLVFVSLGDSWWLDPVGEFLVNCFKWPVSFGNIIAGRDRLRRIGTHGRWFEVAGILWKTNRAWALLLLTELRNTIFAVFGQDRAHFKVSLAHLTAKLGSMRLLVAGWGHIVLPSNVLVNSFFISLCHCHHSLFVWWCSQIDIRFGELISQTSWLCSVFGWKSLSYKGLLRLRGILAGLPKIDRIDRFLERGSLSDLPGCPLALSYLIIGLILSSCWLLASMAIIEGKVASLNSFTLRLLLHCTADQSMLGRGLIHGGRACLRREPIRT